MTRHEIKALLRGSTSEDQAKLVLDHLAAHPYEAVQVGNTTKAARRFGGQQRVTVIGHVHKPPVYPSVKKGH